MSYQPVGGSGYSTPTPGPYRDDPSGNYGSYGGARSNDYPMASGNPYAATGSEHPRSYPQKKSRKKLWILLGVLLLIGIIVGVVVGAVVGTRNNKDNNKTSSANDKSNSGANKPNGNSDNNNAGNAGPDKVNSAVASQTDSSGRPTALPSLVSYIDTPAKEYRVGSNGNVYLPLATDVYMLPAYGIGTATSGYAAPAMNTAAADDGKWPADPDSPSQSSPRAHPRLIAPGYKWEALKKNLIAADPYLSYWNDTIIGNASKTLSDPPVEYRFDGGPTGSGVLDVAREVKMKIKNWAYAHRITGNTEYGARVWAELQHSANVGNVLSNAPSGDIWNCGGHFLDCAEFTSAYAIAYDWLYDYWTEDQRSSIRGWIVTNGLSKGTPAGWWAGDANKVINGNWNCVSNAGLLLGSLAIVDEDTTGTASALITRTIENSKNNCFKGAYSDGTWAETANYWYFGATGAAEMVSALQTAYGQSFDLDTVNPGWKFNSLAHMYVQGMTSLFNYGDHGPNKFSSTANSLMLWGSLYNEPRYTLYQRDQYDASEPFSMFWYDPSVSGVWWNGLAIDKHFDAKEGEWVAARSSWTDNSGSYWAMKAGSLQDHQNHNDLDIGDFVLDAMGQRWAGELGSDQYLGYQYFDGDTQSAGRWSYYRKRTEGQNTVLINKENQLLSAAPTVKYESSGTEQGGMTALSLDKSDTAFMTIDMSSAYASGITAKRGIRFLNGRSQILLQDEISGSGVNDIMWRIHTNASVSVDGDGTTATLSLSERTMKVQLLNAQPAGLKFSTMQDTYISGESGMPVSGGNADNLNESIPNNSTVLVIENSSGGSMHTEVLFTPQWPGRADTDYVTPSSVGLDSWSLTSHN